MIFARAPVAGKAKTRLIPALGRQGAADLHAYLVERTLRQVNATPGVDVALWCTPSVEHGFFRSCAQKFAVTLHGQQGLDLGCRMHNAFEVTLRAAPWAILVGSDCPELESGDIQQAIDILQHGSQAAIGPAFDGGYYLIGLRHSSPLLFEEVPWGTESVWQITADRLATLGWFYQTLAQRHDLDQPQDLKRFPNLPTAGRA